MRPSSVVPCHLKEGGIWFDQGKFLEFLDGPRSVQQSIQRIIGCECIELKPHYLTWHRHQIPLWMFFRNSGEELRAYLEALALAVFGGARCNGMEDFEVAVIRELERRKLEPDVPAYSGEMLPDFWLDTVHDVIFMIVNPRLVDLYIVLLNKKMKKEKAG